MKKNYLTNSILTVIATVLFLSTLFAKADEDHMEHPHDHGDDPVITKVMLDQLELRNAEDGYIGVIEAHAWIGKDLNKFWLKAAIEKNGNETEDAEIQALYSHAIATYWDLQLGLRKDVKPSPNRTWSVLGIQGLAPYFFDIDAALFVGEAGRTAARVSIDYDLLFTQKLILSPEIKINAYGQTDNETGTGSGLSDINAGLRLRYELRREVAPYIGVDWNKKFGGTANFARHNNETISDTQWVLGLRVWF